MGLTTHFCISANFNEPWSLNDIPHQSLSEWVLVQNTNYLSLTFKCYTFCRYIFTFILVYMWDNNGMKWMGFWSAEDAFQTYFAYKIFYLSEAKTFP